MTTGPRDLWFVVPVGGVQTFCVVRDGQLVPQNPLPMVGDGELAVDQGFGWVAWVPPGGREVRWTHLDAGDGRRRFPPLPLPDGYRAECLQFHGPVLYVGGDCGKEVVGLFDLSADTPRWAPLDVPEEFRRDGKRVDDLLLDGDELIAVDDHYVPKYLLLYDVADPRRPRLTQVREIPPLWWGERIHAGAVGANWLALLSSGGGTIVGPRIQIGLYDPQTRGLYGVLAAYPDCQHVGIGLTGHLDSMPRRTWHQPTFLRDVLLIAADRDGVGVLDLSALDRPANPVAIGPTGRGRMVLADLTDEHQRFSAACEAALRYVRPVGLGGPVVRVEPVPDSRHYLAVVHTPAGLDTAIMTLP